MQITKCITVEQEIEVDIDVSISDVISEIKSFDTPEKMHQANRLLSASIMAIKLIPDSLIKEMTESHKGTIALNLKEQLDRYC